MKFTETQHGTALYVNGVIVGWITSTIDGKWLYGVTNQKTNMKDVVETKQQAVLELLKSIGE